MTNQAIDPKPLLDRRGLPDLAEARLRMVERLVADLNLPASISDVLRSVPRHAFAPPNLWRLGYSEMELWSPGFFLPSPSVVARVLARIVDFGAKNVCEYGSWTGYTSVLLSYLVPKVDTVEHNPWLLWMAADAYRALNRTNVLQKASDGKLGWPERAPYDVIFFGASIPYAFPAVIEQLADNGALIAPIGPPNAPQTLTVIIKKGESLVIEELCTCIFPPLMGVWNWSSAQTANSTHSYQGLSSDQNPSLEGDWTRYFYPGRTAIEGKDASNIEGEFIEGKDSGPESGSRDEGIDQLAVNAGKKKERKR